MNLHNNFGVSAEKFTSDMLSADEKKKEYVDVVIQKICELGEIKAAYDFGCGSGIYVQALIDKGVKTLGFDSNEKLLSKLNTSVKNLRFLDLSKNIFDLFFFRPRDLIISFEIAEHIARNKIDVFFQNIITLADDWIVLTASPDVGTYHLNPQPRRYWIDHVEKFSVHLYQEDLTENIMEYFRSKIPDDQLVWFRRDLMIFKKVPKGDV